MKVFISWSGAAEQHVAESLRDALKSVCAGEVEPFVSSQDIPLGERGVPMIEAKLSSTDYGIVVLSAANKDRPWINYEGGALATLLNRRVAVVLMDLNRAEVDTPLAPFQSARFTDRAEMLRLFTEIAQQARDTFPTGTVATLFDAEWDNIQMAWNPDADPEPRQSRSMQAMLEEVVERVRSIDRGQSRTIPHLPPQSFARGDDELAALRGAVAMASGATVHVDSVVHTLGGVFVECSTDRAMTQGTQKAALDEILRRYGDIAKVTFVSPSEMATDDGPGSRDA